VKRCYRCGGELYGQLCRFCLERDRLAGGAAPVFVLTSREAWFFVLAGLFVGWAIGRFSP
jgi:hypothetical protein